MQKLQITGVKRLPLNMRICSAIQLITGNGMADVGQVDPNLMGSSRMKRQLHQSVPVSEVLQDPHIRHRILPAFRHNTSLHLILIRTADGQVDGEEIFFHISQHHRPILLHRSLISHLVGNIVLGIGILRHDDDSAGIHIQSVGESDLEGLIRIVHVFHDTVGQGMTGMSLGGVYRHPRLLVDNQDIFILVQGRDWDIFHGKITGFLRKADHDFISRLGS